MSDQTMPAGPELDAMLAEKMGLKVFRHPPHWGDHAGYYTGWRNEDTLEPVKPYSTEPSAAIAAAEEMRKAGRIDGWMLESPYRDRPTTALAFVDSRPEPADIVAGQGSSLAHSLSLALAEALR